MKNNPMKMKTANTLAIIIAFCSYSMGFLLFIVSIPAENKEILIMMIGYLLGTGLNGVIFFLYNYKNNRSGEIVNGSDGSNEICECCGQVILKQ
jgi:hypothetical protein